MNKVKDIKLDKKLNKKLLLSFEEFWEKNKTSLLDEFFALLKFKSISTIPKYRDELFNCFVFLRDYIRKIADFDTYVIGKSIQENINSLDEPKLKNFLKLNFKDPKQNPVLVAFLEQDKNLPWVLIYGHYDVQPADKNKWKSLPFEPTIKDNKILARGASDDKGRFFASLIGLKFLLKNKLLKQNIVLVIEGEEEIAGNTVKTAFEFIKSKVGTPKILYINDTTWFTNEIPSIMYSLRGAVAFELYIKTGESNLHSGLYGNIALNAGNLASYVVFKLKDIIRNRLRIDRLNRLVRKPSNEEIKFLANISPNWKQAQENSKTYFVTKYRRKSGEFLPLHMIGLRPSLDVNGISAGYTGEGLKMIIPNEAFVKFSIRTVPYMTEEKTISLVNKYIEKILHRFKGIKYKLDVFASAPYVWQDYNDYYMQLMQNIMSLIFNKQVYFVPHGASNLAAGVAKSVFKNSTLLMPAIGKPSHNIHAPNENIEIDMLKNGALILAFMLQYI